MLSDGPPGAPVGSVRVAPPQAKLAEGTFGVLGGVPDEVPPPEEVPPPPDEVVPPDEVPPPDEGVPVDVLAVDGVPEAAVAVDEVAASGEVAPEEPPPPHPITITEAAAAAAAAVKVERIVKAVAASFKSRRIPGWGSLKFQLREAQFGLE
jgi:hypothetical protein